MDSLNLIKHTLILVYVNLIQKKKSQLLLIYMIFTNDELIQTDSISILQCIFQIEKVLEEEESRE
jgi:hypothetical protein